MSHAEIVAETGAPSLDQDSLTERSITHVFVTNLAHRWREYRHRSHVGSLTSLEVRRRVIEGAAASESSKRRSGL
jgi:hypothetical protein